MTDQSEDSEDHQSPENQENAPDEEADDQPVIDDDEMADLDAIADDVEDDVQDDVDDQEADQGETDDAGEDLTDDSTSGSSRSWGKMYTKGVVKLDEALLEEFGDGDADPITEAEVQDLELDEAFDEWVATKTGRPEDIPPGQWVAIGTIMLIGGNVLTETDLAKEALDDGI